MGLDNDASLDQLLQVMQTELGELVISEIFRLNGTVAGHDMRYLYYEVLDTEGVPFVFGIISVWYCEESNREMAILYYSLEQDAFAVFLPIIETMQCHNLGAQISR